VAAIVVSPSKSEFLTFQKRVPIFWHQDRRFLCGKADAPTGIELPKTVVYYLSAKSSIAHAMGKKKNHLHGNLLDKSGKRRRLPCGQPKPTGV
jgi:hypothetical protein